MKLKTFFDTLCYISIKIINSQLCPLFLFCYHLWVTGPYQGIAGWVRFSEGTPIHTAWFRGHETLCFTYTGTDLLYKIEPLLLVATAPCTVVSSTPSGTWKSQARGCSAHTEQLRDGHIGKLSFSYTYSPGCTGPTVQTNNMWEIPFLDYTTPVGLHQHENITELHLEVTPSTRVMSFFGFDVAMITFLNKFDVPKLAKNSC